MAKIRRAKRLAYKLSYMPRYMETAYVKSMQKTVLHVRAESQRITPVRTGNLRASARSDARRKGKGATGIVWYGADYAVPVHERTWTKLVNGQHKFLEKAMLRSRKVVWDILASEIKIGLRKFSA